MVDALTGYTRPAAGRITFDGRDIGTLRPYRRARLGLARTFQSVELFDDLTVEENLLVASEHVTVASALSDLFAARRARRTATGVDWAISVCGLEDVADRYPAEISLGQRKLVGIGRALARAAAAGPARRARRRASTPTRASSSGAGCGRCRRARRDGLPDRPRHGARAVPSAITVMVLDFGRQIAERHPGRDPATTRR